MEEELDFALERHLDDGDCDDIELPYEALEAITKQQKRFLERCKESVAKAKEDGDISYEQEYICMKRMKALEKRTLAKMKKSQMKTLHIFGKGTNVIIPFALECALFTGGNKLFSIL